MPSPLSRPPSYFVAGGFGQDLEKLDGALQTAGAEAAATPSPAQAPAAKK